MENLLGLPGLLERCAELDYFPLVHAAWRSDVDLMELLIQHGVDVNACGKNGVSAYAVAVKIGNRVKHSNKGVIDLLRKYGAEEVPP